MQSPELCDYRVPGSNSFCCDPTTCRPIRVGLNCGSSGDCGTPLCAPDGRCRTQDLFIGRDCRSAGTLGACDPGAKCGEAPECPADDLESGCSAEQFRLKASNASGQLSLRCEGVKVRSRSDFPNAPSCAAEIRGGAPGDAQPQAKRRRVIKPEVALTATCDTPQFSVSLGGTAAKRLKAGGPGELQRLITSKIPRENLEYFSSGRTLCVRVAFEDGSGHIRNRLYLVTFR